MAGEALSAGGLTLNVIAVVISALGTLLVYTSFFVSTCPALQRSMFMWLKSRRWSAGWKKDDDRAWARPICRTRHLHIVQCVAAAFLVWELAHSLNILFLPANWCSVESGPRLGRVSLIYTISSILAFLFLKSPTGLLSPVVVYTVAVGMLASRLSCDIVSGEHGWFKSGRAASEIIWRTLCTLGMTPFGAVVIIGLYMLLSHILYLQDLPERAVVVLPSLSGFEIGEGCVQVFRPEELEGATAQVSSWLTQAMMSQVTDPSLFLATELYISGCALVFGLGLTRFFMKEAIVAAERQSQDGLTFAVHGVLESLCDAVVVLDSQFTVIEPSPRLAAMLICHADLKGSCLLDRIHPASVEYFKKALQKPIRGSKEPASRSLQTAVPIAFKDSSGLEIRCHGFHAAFVDPFGSAKYVLGLSEVLERDRPVLEGAPTFEKIGMEEVSETSSAGSSDEGSSILAVGEVCAFKFRLPDTLILETSGNGNVKAPLEKLLQPGAKLFECLYRSEDFTQFLITRCTQLGHGEFKPPIEFSHAPIRFKTVTQPGQKRDKRKYKIFVYFPLEEPGKAYSVSARVVRHHNEQGGSFTGELSLSTTRRGRKSSRKCEDPGSPDAPRGSPSAPFESGSFAALPRKSGTPPTSPGAKGVDPSLIMAL